MPFKRKKTPSIKPSAFDDMTAGDIEELIIASSFRYYKESDDKPLLITDDQFDLALKTLKRLKPKSEILTKPGWGHVDEKAFGKHIGKAKVGSLDKIDYPAYPKDMINTIIMPKMDGLQIVSYFWIRSENDIKVTALTRHNGITGKDVTANFMRVLEPEAFDEIRDQKQGLFAVKGEVIVPPGNMEIIKKLDPNLKRIRGTASGLMNRDEPSELLRYLKYVPYFIRIDDNRSYSSRFDMLEELDRLRFTSCPRDFFSLEVDKISKLEILHEKWKEKFPIDGIVLAPIGEPMEIRDGDYSVEEPRAISIKFESEQKEAVVSHVEWVTGKSGKLAPTSVFTSPVELDAEVLRATACNAKRVKEWGIGETAIVVVQKANEVIPEIVKVVQKGEVALPSECPMCKAHVEWEGVDLVCTDMSCPARSFAVIYNLFEAAKIPKGLGDVTLSEYLEKIHVEEKIIKIKTIFGFAPAFKKREGADVRLKILQKLHGEHYGGLLLKLEENIGKLFDEGLTLQQYWNVVNIKGLGPEISNRMSGIDPKSLRLFDREDGHAYLKTKDVPSNVREEIFDRGNIEESSWYKAAEVLPIKVDVIKLNANLDWRIMITGATAVCKDRTDFEERCAEIGVKVAGPSKKARYLICNDAENPTNKGHKKFKLATSCQIPIMTEEKFFNIPEVKAAEAENQEENLDDVDLDEVDF